MAEIEERNDLDVSKKGSTEDEKPMTGEMVAASESVKVGGNSGNFLKVEQALLGS